MLNLHFWYHYAQQNPFLTQKSADPDVIYVKYFAWSDLRSLIIEKFANDQL